MFGIFGGGMVSPTTMLNPFRVAGVPFSSSAYMPYSYVPPVTSPAIPAAPSTPQTYYADYRNYNFGVPLKGLSSTVSNLKPVIPQTGIPSLPTGWTPQTGIIQQPLPQTTLPVKPIAPILPTKTTAFKTTLPLVKR